MKNDHPISLTITDYHIFKGATYYRLRLSLPNALYTTSLRFSQLREISSTLTASSEFPASRSLASLFCMLTKDDELLARRMAEMNKYFLSVTIGPQHPIIQELINNGAKLERPSVSQEVNEPPKIVKRGKKLSPLKLANQLYIIVQ